MIAVVLWEECSLSAAVTMQPPPPAVTVIHVIYIHINPLMTASAQYRTDHAH